VFSAAVAGDVMRDWARLKFGAPVFAQGGQYLELSGFYARGERFSEYVSVGHRRGRPADEILSRPDVVIAAKFGATDRQTGSKRSSELPVVRPRVSNPIGNAPAQHFEYVLVQNRTIRHRSLCQNSGINAAATS
jgi:hypothetical protein